MTGQKKKRENIYADSLAFHEKYHGKIEVHSKVRLKNRHDLSLAYTPGVGAVSKEIAKDPKLAWKYTLKANTIAIVSDGSRVLSLGISGATPRSP